MESIAITTGWKCFWWYNFSKEISKVSKVRCFGNLHGVLPKFCFREKRRHKFQQWRKMYCLDIFQMNHFGFFCCCCWELVFFNTKVTKGKTVLKGCDFSKVTYFDWTAIFWCVWKTGSEIFHCREIQSFQPLHFLSFTCIASGRVKNGKIQVKYVPLNVFLHKVIFLCLQAFTAKIFCKTTWSGPYNVQ